MKTETNETTNKILTSKEIKNLEAWITALYKKELTKDIITNNLPLHSVKLDTTIDILSKKFTTKTGIDFTHLTDDEKAMYAKSVQLKNRIGKDLSYFLGNYASDRPRKDDKKPRKTVKTEFEKFLAVVENSLPYNGKKLDISIPIKDLKELYKSYTDIKDDEAFILILRSKIGMELQDRLNSILDKDLTVNTMFCLNLILHNMIYSRRSFIGLTNSRLLYLRDRDLIHRGNFYPSEKPLFQNLLKYIEAYQEINLETGKQKETGNQIK